MNPKEYKAYYAEKLEEANEFQDFVCLQLSKLGIIVTVFSSKKYQFEIGESLQGFEFKNDQKFRLTGNLYIEVAEKSSPSKIEYASSGILRGDNTLFYVTGDRIGIYLMQKTVLVAIYKKGKYRVIENRTKTSRGFLFPVADAEKYFKYIKF
jgi:hypothetical protein